jgi:hypothetical protein
MRMPMDKSLPDAAKILFIGVTPDSPSSYFLQKRLIFLI